MSGTVSDITVRELPLRRPLRSVARRPRGPHPPLVVTDRALDQLGGILDRHRRRATQALGFAVEPGGAIGLVVDEPGERDRTFALNGRTVLFVAAEAADRLAGRVLDRTGADAAGRFTLLPADGGAR